MKTPFLLLGAGLIFWGWQTGLWPLAVIMALILEGSRLIKSRFELSSSDFNRAADVCTLLFLGMFVYIVASNRSARAILVLLQWLPLAFLPLVFLQIYSTSERIAISALFLFFRIERVKRENIFPKAINLTYPYFGLCILSASAANVRTLWFYMGLLLICAWALWQVRSRRYPPIFWVSLFVSAGFVGYGGHMGLHSLQISIEDKAFELFDSFNRKDADPYHTKTAIGDMGALKLSDSILFRVITQSPYKKPLLLHEASYNVYKASTWFAARARFKAIRPEDVGSTWNLREDSGDSQMITISTYLKGGKGMLKLPPGAFEIGRLPVLKMVANQYGAVKVEEGPGLIHYQVRFKNNLRYESSPEEMDLIVPEKELPGLTIIAKRLGLHTKSPQEILKILAAFFQKDFRYALFLNSSVNSPTPVVDFIEQTRSGHCEYFATATVLLLRAVGIPARYATGYSVQEFSRLEKLFIVRARHAHSWALVYMNGAWHDFDTTPISWFAIERESASIFEPLYDLWSLVTFKISEWRWRERKRSLTKHIAWLLIPLILLLGKRLYSRRLIKPTKGERGGTGRERIKSGMDSEFYLIEKRLIELGYGRYQWETLSSWIKRIKEQFPSLSTTVMQSILSLHYRYRFDPMGITLDEKLALKSNVQEWLEQE